MNQYTVATEIFPTHLRSQGSSYSLAAFFLTDVLWVDLAATAEARIGWKYYLVFLILGTVHLIHLWFKLPEVCMLLGLFHIQRLIRNLRLRVWHWRKSMLCLGRSKLLPMLRIRVRKELWLRRSARCENLIELSGLMEYRWLLGCSFL